MPVERVEDPGDPRLADYCRVSDPELLRRGEVFVAEGRAVVRALLTRSSYRVRSLLLTDAALRGLADVVEPRLGGLTVHLVDRRAMETLTGFNLHRGCLALGERPPAVPLSALFDRLPACLRLVVLERIANADNMGGIFRNAAAFGADAVVLGPGCCDPLYRKAIRVSMGTSLSVPFFTSRDWPADLDVLRAHGLVVAALTPGPGARDIAAFAAELETGAGIAVLAGAEDGGLSDEALARADAAVRIPMAAGLDSLNVATATGIALHRLFAPVTPRPAR